MNQPFSPRGFALVPALFLIVVLAALGAVAIRVGDGEQQTVTMALQQVRALAAARAGVEWGAYSALINHSCAASTTLNLSDGALSGFTVVVNCSAATDATVTPSKSSYVLIANSSSGTYGQPGYVHRVVSSTFTDAT
jgi:MSHA biogenesis protein MshP